jgi:hypothetical protein
VNPAYLRALTVRYAGPADDDPGAFEELRKRYRQYRATSLIDLAAVATTLGLDNLSDRSLDPLALKAIQDTNPNFDPNRLLGYSDDEWIGIVNSAKGKYFEYLVVDRLNSGESVGDVVLPDGYTARLADSMNQPGWDVQIMDDHGHVTEYLQLKATESAGYIHHALNVYPDITILATSEVAHDLPHNSMVLDSQISERDIGNVVGNSLDDAGSGFLDHFWDSFHPIFPLLLIAGMQGYAVAVGKQSVVSAVDVARARAARSLTAAGVGALVKVFGGGWFSIPAAIFTGWIFDRSQNIDDLVMATREQNRFLAARRDFYDALLTKAV